MSMMKAPQQWTLCIYEVVLRVWRMEAGAAGENWGAAGRPECPDGWAAAAAGPGAVGPGGSLISFFFFF